MHRDKAAPGYGRFFSSILLMVQLVKVGQTIAVVLGLSLVVGGVITLSVVLTKQSSRNIGIGVIAASTTERPLYSSEFASSTLYGDFTSSLSTRQEATTSWLLHSTFPSLESRTTIWTAPPPINVSTASVYTAHYSMGYGDAEVRMLEKFPEIGHITHAFAAGTWIPGQSYWEETIPKAGVVATLKRRGGNIMVAFGGEASCRTGTEPALRGWSPDQVAKAYEDKLNEMNTDFLDLDIELGREKERSTFLVRNEALLFMQTRRPSVKIIFTLPASVDGLTSLEMLMDLHKRGVIIHTIRPMSMFWGVRTDIYESTVRLLKAVRAQLDTIGLRRTKLGYTPLLGSDDIGNDQTPQVTQRVADFIKANPSLSICTFSFWEVARDAPDFVHTFILLQAAKSAVASGFC